MPTQLSLGLLAVDGVPMIRVVHADPISCLSPAYPGLERRQSRAVLSSIAPECGIMHAVWRASRWFATLAHIDYVEIDEIAKGGGAGDGRACRHPPGSPLGGPSDGHRRGVGTSRAAKRPFRLIWTQVSTRGERGEREAIFLCGSYVQ